MVDPGSHAPPSSAPPATARPGSGAPRREILLPLQRAGQKGGWRRRRAGGDQDEDRIRLVGAQIVLEHAGALHAPLAIPAGLVALAAVDPGPADAGPDSGRFPILRRMSPTAVVPMSEGVEGWLWTRKSGSALPALTEEAPNLALVFVKPLEGQLVEAHFEPAFLDALANQSPLGTPTVFGLLARVADTTAAEQAFGELGVCGPVTDREVAPARRRHLPSDRPANPAIGFTQDRRESTSVPPPGPGRRPGDR